jgi:hypothetical protein
MWAAPSSRQMLSVAGADLPCIGGGEAILVGGGLASLSFQSSYVPDDRPSGGDALMGTDARPTKEPSPAKKTRYKPGTGLLRTWLSWNRKVDLGGGRSISLWRVGVQHACPGFVGMVVVVSGFGLLGIFSRWVMVGAVGVYVVLVCLSIRLRGWVPER